MGMSLGRNWRRKLGNQFTCRSLVELDVTVGSNRSDGEEEWFLIRNSIVEEAVRLLG